MTYQFTTDWFEAFKGTWDNFLQQIRVERILEVGSFEGGSSCYFIEKIGMVNSIELYCIDSWQGGPEHEGIDMAAVEKRFDKNIELAISKVNNPVALHKIKDASDTALCKLLAGGKREYFDLIYIDGSHLAPDVL